MKSCHQMKGMSILEHGHSVHEYYKDLYDHLYNGTPLKHEWKLPQLLLDNKDALFPNLLSEEDARLYAVYHDCGKPFCRQEDAEGRQHFPDHALHSYQTWIACGGSEAVGWYILHDMDLHTLRGDELKAFLKDPRVPTLLLMAFAEIHSNASMFGGIESTSFKIKWKHLDKVTKWYFAE